MLWMGSPDLTIAGPSIRSRFDSWRGRQIHPSGNTTIQGFLGNPTLLNDCLVCRLFVVEPNKDETVVLPECCPCGNSVNIRIPRMEGFFLNYWSSLTISLTGAVRGAVVYFVIGDPVAKECELLKGGECADLKSLLYLSASGCRIFIR